MNKLAFPILAVLADGKFHSGEALAQRFGVTRATVFNAIQAAQTLGITVLSVHGRGYRLPQPVVLLEQEAILAACGDYAPWFHMQVLAQVDSTNRYLMQESVRGVPHATCVVAQVQTAGRGRRGRNWLSKLGGSLTFSLLWRFQCGAAGLSGLSLVVGLALVRALHGMGLVDVRLKWPNDLIVQTHGEWQKLGGILIELQGDMEGPSAAVIGVGLNLDVDTTLRQQIDQAAMGLNQLYGKALDPNQVLGRCLASLAEHLNLFAEHGFSYFQPQWAAYHAFHQQAVDLHLVNGQVLPGRVIDIAEEGSLLVETASGIQRFNAGEISVRSAE
ncbi:biotin--[acetyl-CoA-carboxylase] ligase [Methylophilus aquaticus]|uniref:Bifunctional ligase/repressor BirA n=1 Tax=Methylophilus aquaticus TaxID=1971610 RepID=A0ABT9JSM8_9PROT|nr:biotin--[acetyl-CoA-carboxylase] ligase [Methylophilus aquaticus]MDP8567572.1 biotin--[acetyl-CoA-carboxylase] ligase [Methylophilus aquaticus]